MICFSGCPSMHRPFKSMQYIEGIKQLIRGKGKNVTTVALERTVVRKVLRKRIINATRYHDLTRNF